MKTEEDYSEGKDWISGRGNCGEESSEEKKEHQGNLPHWYGFNKR